MWINWRQPAWWLGQDDRLVQEQPPHIVVARRLESELGRDLHAPSANANQI